ncbi:MAG: VOC family protein [Simkaniaceae bacterium]|nr:VOC family protein [Simkaniaceae bacterium]
MISQIGEVTIPVTDQNRAVEFYTKCLNFEVAHDIPFDENQRWIELKIPGTETAIVLFTMEGHQDRIGTLSNIVFNCENLEDTFEKMTQNGIEFVQNPTKESWGSFALFKDPDGNIFCVSSHASAAVS